MARGLIALIALLCAADASAAQAGWQRLGPRPGEPADTAMVGYGVEALGDAAEPALLVCRCHAGELELYVIADSVLVDSAVVRGRREIAEFLDAAPARREPWNVSTDRGALFAPDPHALGERLSATDRLWLGFGNSRGLEFSVRGFAQPWKALLAACPPRTSPNPAFGQYVQVDELPQPIRKGSPVYPPEAKAQRLEGTVVVQVLVGRDGAVVDTKVVKSVPILDAAAVASARQWTFVPAQANGQPVAVWVAVPIKFSLQ